MIHCIYFAGLPQVIVVPSYQYVEVTNDAVFEAVVEGVGYENFQYLWKVGDMNITNEINSTLILQNVNESHSDVYVCYVSNEYGDSAVSDVVFLNVTSEYRILDKH